MNADKRKLKELGEAFDKLAAELQLVHRRANELEQQLEATEAALLRARQDLAVEINQVGSATPSLDFWQHEAERLQRELTRARFIPPRLEAADDKAFRKAGVH